MEGSGAWPVVGDGIGHRGLRVYGVPGKNGGDGGLRGGEERVPEWSWGEREPGMAQILEEADGKAPATRVDGGHGERSGLVQRVSGRERK